MKRKKEKNKTERRPPPPLLPLLLSKKNLADHFSFPPTQVSKQLLSNFMTSRRLLCSTSAPGAVAGCGALLGMGRTLARLRGGRSIIVWVREFGRSICFRHSQRRRLTGVACIFGSIGYLHEGAICCRMANLDMNWTKSTVEAGKLLVGTACLVVVGLVGLGHAHVFQASDNA